MSTVVGSGRVGVLAVAGRVVFGVASAVAALLVLARIRHQVGRPPDGWARPTRARSGSQSSADVRPEWGSGADVQPGRQSGADVRPGRADGGSVRPGSEGGADVRSGSESSADVRQGWVNAGL